MALSPKTFRQFQKHLLVILTAGEGVLAVFGFNPLRPGGHIVNRREDIVHLVFIQVIGIIFIRKGQCVIFGVGIDHYAVAPVRLLPIPGLNLPFGYKPPSIYWFIRPLFDHLFQPDIVLLQPGKNVVLLDLSRLRLQPRDQPGPFQFLRLELALCGPCLQVSNDLRRGAIGEFPGKELFHLAVPL